MSTWNLVKGAATIAMTATLAGTGCGSSHPTASGSCARHFISQEQLTRIFKRAGVPLVLLPLPPDVTNTRLYRPLETRLSDALDVAWFRNEGLAKRWLAKYGFSRQPPVQRSWVVKANVLSIFKTPNRKTRRQLSVPVDRLCS